MFKKSKIFFTSDLHFSHKNVIEYCNRPWLDTYQMNESIVEYWNKTVSTNDSIYILGDFSLNPGTVDKYLPRLNGHKILIIGNHDTPFKNWKNGVYYASHAHNRYTKAGFKEITPIKYLTLFKPNKYFGWLGVGKKYNVTLSHFPYRHNHMDERYMSYRLIDNGGWLLHGHLHAKYIKLNKQIDVGFDGNLKFYSEEDIINLIEDERGFIESRVTEFYRKRKK